MSEQLTSLTTTAPPSPGATAPSAKEPPQKVEPLFPIHRSWAIATVVAVLMVLLALVGVAFTTASSSFAPTYWVSLVPVYGLLCLGIAYLRAKHGGHMEWRQVVRQGLHWVGIAIALGLDFFIRRTGEESSLAAGMNAVLLLALGCYLAGVHLEWLFVPVGVLLSLTLVLVVKADQYLWLVFLVGAATIVLMLGGMWLLRDRSRKAAGA